MLHTSDFDYSLPTELIAQTPLEARDASRLLVLHRSDGRLEHRKFTALLDYVRPGDVMVFNQSRVIPARLRGRREDTGGRVELLLLKQEADGVWQALAKPGRRLRPGQKVILEPAGLLPAADATVEMAVNARIPSLANEGSGEVNPGEETPLAVAEILSSHPDGIKRVRLGPGADLDYLGEMPLPPYIHQRLNDPQRYQTIYASTPGSAAAPTAGLHFTKDLMDRLEDAGVETVFVTLHVGLDTFRPVQGEDPAAHEIHTEYFNLSADAAGAINKARQEGRRVIAVGTTSVRVLEHAAVLAAKSGATQIAPATGQANLFILPGHQFRVVDALITNFHLPRSTLLMLVSAFAERDASTSSGRATILNAYQAAIEQRYRFYSFGDAMLIL